MAAMTASTPPIFAALAALSPCLKFNICLFFFAPSSNPLILLAASFGLRLLSWFNSLPISEANRAMKELYLYASSQSDKSSVYYKMF